MLKCLKKKKDFLIHFEIKLGRMEPMSGHYLAWSGYALVYKTVDADSDLKERLKKVSLLSYA